MNELFEKLNKLKEEQKRGIEESKKYAKKNIDNAEECYIVLTEKGNALVGSTPMLIALTTTLLKKLLEKNIMDEKLLNRIVELAKQSDEELEKEAKDKIKKMFDMFMGD